MAASSWPSLLDGSVLLVAVLYVFVCPFTKVEESFNAQASHDLIFTPKLEHYDHHEFPGVVPRTFLGAGVLALVSWPVSFLGHAAGLLPKLWTLLVVRAHLAALVWWPWRTLRVELSRRGGADYGICFALVTLSQFHFLFYASRPLPNTMALVFVMWSYVHYVREHYYAVIAALVFALAVFRCDVLVLFVPLYLWMAATGKVSVVSSVPFGIAVGLASVALSVAVDSYFWATSPALWVQLSRDRVAALLGRLMFSNSGNSTSSGGSSSSSNAAMGSAPSAASTPVESMVDFIGTLRWPEGEVLFYNTILNKSSQWGTMPFHW